MLQSLFNKVAGLKTSNLPATLLKIDPNKNVFLWILENVSEQIFNGISLVAISEATLNLFYATVPFSSMYGIFWNFFGKKQKVLNYNEKPTKYKFKRNWNWRFRKRHYCSKILSAHIQGDTLTIILMNLWTTNGQLVPHIVSKCPFFNPQCLCNPLPKSFRLLSRLHEYNTIQYCSSR